MVAPNVVENDITLYNEQTIYSSRFKTFTVEVGGVCIVNALTPNALDTTNGSLNIVYYMVSSGLIEVFFQKFT